MTHLREAFNRTLEQGLDYVLSDTETFNDPSRFNQLQKDNRAKIADYFMSITDKIKLEELRFLLAHLQTCYTAYDIIIK
jgi:hypothetical protein